MHAYCITAFPAYIKTSMDRMNNLHSWITPEELVEWAKFSLHIDRPNSQMTDNDIRQTIRWIGDYSFDTIYFDDGKTQLGRIGVNNMLLVTLMVFPHYYVKYELSQFN